MEFGVCAEPDASKVVKDGGFQFIELNVQSHLMPDKPENEFLKVLDKIKAGPIPALIANCFIPGSLKITGNDANFAKLETYCGTAIKRAEKAGIKIIVFGSGGARNIPDAFDREKAREQIVKFCRMAGVKAAEHGVTIVLEPLNTKECNVLNTVLESADYVREIDNPSVRLLVDSYHWKMNAESPEDIVSAGNLLAHVHIATAPTRLAPGQEEFDFSDFFSALLKANYDRYVTIEGKWPLAELGFSITKDGGRDVNANLTKAMKVLKDFIQ